MTLEALTIGIIAGIVIFTEPIDFTSATIVSTSDKELVCDNEDRNLLAHGRDLSTFAGTTSPDTTVWETSVRTEIHSVWAHAATQEEIHKLNNKVVLGFRFMDQDGNTIELEDTIGSLFWVLEAFTDYDYIYSMINPEACTASHFPSELADQLVGMNIGDYFCMDNAVDVLLQSTYTTETGNAKFQYSSFERCIDTNDLPCDPNEVEIALHMTGFEVIYSHAVYDHGDLDNPIKYILNTDHINRIDFHDTLLSTYYVQPNVVNYLNGTSETFYSMSRIDMTISFTWGSNPKFLSYVLLANEYNTYTQHEHIQPDLTSTFRRQLETTHKENSQEEVSSMPYFAALASVGGVYFFCIAMLGLIIKPIVDISLVQQLLNRSRNRSTQAIEALASYKGNITFGLGLW